MLVDLLTNTKTVEASSAISRLSLWCPSPVVLSIGPSTCLHTRGYGKPFHLQVPPFQFHEVLTIKSHDHQTNSCLLYMLVKIPGIYCDPHRSSKVHEIVVTGTHYIGNMETGVFQRD